MDQMVTRITNQVLEGLRKDNENLMEKVFEKFSSVISNNNASQSPDVVFGPETLYEKYNIDLPVKSFEEFDRLEIALQQNDFLTDFVSLI